MGSFAPFRTPVLLFVLTSCFSFCNAADFLARGEEITMEVESLLRAEVESRFGKHSTTERISVLEDRLLPLFSALPKMGENRLAPTTVRYAMHRYFSQQHGWMLTELDPNGGAWNGSSPAEFLRGRVPNTLHAMFEEHLEMHGFSLHELAVMATAFEHIVNSETATRLEAAYEALDIPTNSHLTVEEVEEVVDAHFIMYLFNIAKEKTHMVKRIRQKVHRGYPGWADLASWTRDIRATLALAEGRTTRNPFKDLRYEFLDVLKLVEVTLDHYGQFQDHECQDLKGTLSTFEYRGTGRVPLKDFYGIAVGGDWRFSETTPYLRSLGALDESNPEVPFVLIPNYMYGRSMCIGSSSYYNVCCINECDELIGRLETRLQVPKASPGDVATALRDIHSSTVAAPRNLSAHVLERLDEIAQTHGGMVPLHGRLFSQLMHTAFPRECAYPHVSGTTDPMTGQEWKKRSGSPITMTVDSLKEAGFEPREVSKVDFPDDEDEDLDQDQSHFAKVWTPIEELFVDLPTELKSTTRSSMRMVAMLAAWFGMAVVAFKLIHEAMSAGESGGDKIKVLNV